ARRPRRDPARHAGDPPGCGRPPRARLQPRPRHPQGDAGRAREGARGHGPRDVRPVSAVDAVLLIAFGGPERPEDIRPFLQVVTEGRRIPPERLEEVAHHYEAIGGRSPLNALTRRQADALRGALAADGRPLPVRVGMRNWHPFLHETLAEMKDRGIRRALGIILSSLQTEASWDRYVQDVAAAREKVGPDAPEVVYAPTWGTHPLFIEAMADRARAALDTIPSPRQPDARFVFTAPSVPGAMAPGSPYAEHLACAAGLVAERLGRSDWSLAYQSRSGSPRDPWVPAPPRAGTCWPAPP